MGSRGPTKDVAKQVTMEVRKRETVREDSTIAMFYEPI